MLTASHPSPTWALGHPSREGSFCLLYRRRKPSHARGSYYITSPGSLSQEEKLKIKLRWSDTRAHVLHHNPARPPPSSRRPQGRQRRKPEAGGNGEQTRDSAGPWSFHAEALLPLAAAEEGFQAETLESLRFLILTHTHQDPPGGSEQEWDHLPPGPPQTISGPCCCPSEHAWLMHA